METTSNHDAISTLVFQWALRMISAQYRSATRDKLRTSPTTRVGRLWGDKLKQKAHTFVFNFKSLDPRLPRRAVSWVAGDWTTSVGWMHDGWPRYNNNSGLSSSSSSRSRRYSHMWHEKSSFWYTVTGPSGELWLSKRCPVTVRDLLYWGITTTAAKDFSSFISVRRPTLDDSLSARLNA